MRIVCPACAAAYEVPDGRLSAGRVVRCARCDTDWVPLAEEPTPEPMLAPEPPIEIPVEIVAPPERASAPPPLVAAERPIIIADRPRREGVALRAAWALSVVALVAAVWFAYSAKEAVMQAWPPSVRAYAALGLTARH